MPMRAALAVVLVVAGAHITLVRAQGRGLPEDPCEVMTPVQMSAVSGIEVGSASRVPTIVKIVAAQRGERVPGPGTICSYDTRSPFGSIAIEIPVGRRADTYASARASAFDAYPGATAAVADLGADAWLAGGASLHVLVRDAEYFTITTQNVRPESRDVLVRIARRIVDGLAGTAAARD